MICQLKSQTRKNIFAVIYRVTKNSFTVFHWPPAWLLLSMSRAEAEVTVLASSTTTMVQFEASLLISTLLFPTSKTVTWLTFESLLSEVTSPPRISVTTFWPFSTSLLTTSHSTLIVVSSVFLTMISGT